MRRVKITPLIVLFFLASLVACHEEEIMPEPEKPNETGEHIYPNPVSEKAYAFPGAYGGGMYATGGRGGKVIKVTTLNDNSLPGSLRYAVNQPGARIILFEVSGTIRLNSNLNINHGDITLAGESAPGRGITLADYGVEIKADNVVIRYLRFRMGDQKVSGENDALWSRNRKNIIIDHCSISWSTDECASFYDNENFTLQWSILSESLRLSLHNKGAHGYGGIWGGKNASFLYNLLVHHDSRNPRFCGSRYSNQPDRERVDFRNNLIYNWGANNVYGAEGGSYNIVNNYYKPGPASSNRNRLIQPYADDGKNNQPKGVYGRMYLLGNYLEGNSNVTANNSLGIHMHNTFSEHAPHVSPNDLLADKEFDKAEAHTYTATEAYEIVLKKAGCCLYRDEVDKRLVEEIKYDAPLYKGLSLLNVSPYPKPGIIDSQEDLKPASAGSDWSAWPSLKTDTPPVDSDGDGMPDHWEKNNGLNPAVADAFGRHLSTAYDNIEVYLHDIAKTYE
jgi:pectate lyase